MSQHQPCQFCLKLPAAPTRSGKPTRCPLCKSYLFEIGETTFRLSDSGHAGRSDRRPSVAWLMVVPALAVAGWFALRMLRSASTTDAAPSAHSLAAVGASPIEQQSAPAAPVAPRQAREPRPPQATLASPKPVTPVGRLRGSSAPARLIDGKAKPYREEVRKPEPPPAQPVAFVPWTALPSAEVLQQELLKLPEIILDAGIKPEAKVEEARGRIAALARKIADENNKTPDGFVHELRKSRADLAGLPFLLGEDCQLSQSDAVVLAVASAQVREVIGKCSAQADAFWRAVQQPRSSELARLSWHGPGQHAALAQILAPEDAAFRLGLVRHLGEVSLESSTRTLARLALFDVDAKVRLAATEALQSRPRPYYTPILLAGFRYPWAPVAYHAASAVVQLKRDDLFNDLIDLLDEPDPCAPFETTIDNRKVLAVRELVRINHNRNCLLCHAPAQARAARPSGVVPTPGQRLPEAWSVQYYTGRSGDIFVRADITYLRQDFSLMQSVKEHKDFKWPEMQRFDFLTRVRPATAEELAAWRQRQQRNQQVNFVSPTRDAVLLALRELSGHDLGTSAAAWRALAVRRSGVPAWRSPCLK